MDQARREFIKVATRRIRITSMELSRGVSVCPQVDYKLYRGGLYGREAREKALLKK